jgi:SAM-dependent methyltransferase
MASVLDPITAYDQIAPIYARLSGRRKAYLNAIERLIVDRLPPGSRSLLDVGSGDGSRAARIARAAELRDVTLLEPSPAMRAQCPANFTIWPTRAEALPTQQGSFDVITCLWNVLGHILPAAARLGVLQNLARLLANHGRIFIDVNHRYNARHYGVLPTVVRFLRDLPSPPGTHGDVRVTWEMEGRPCATTGHVFTHPEFAQLARAAGLIIEQRFVVDYQSGELRRRGWSGHLMYVLRR